MSKSKKIIKLWIIPLILFIFFSSLYSRISKNLPVGYQDEMMWVGRSYFFDYFIKGDFNNPVWQSYYSFEQPKLAEYMYGAWLYPQYLKEKKLKKDANFDYVKFLFSNSFHMIHDYYPKPEPNYKIIDFDEAFRGFPNDYLKNYGALSLKTLNIIYYSRIINFSLLSLAIVIIYFLILYCKNLFVALSVSIFYGLSPLFIDSGIIAHSEALFIFLFNGSLMLMVLYFTSKRKLSYLLLFSFLTGLCTATKLNGIMLVFIFLVIKIFDVFFYSKKITKKNILNFYLVFIISFLVFVILNPFVYSNPFIKTLRLYSERAKSATIQSVQFPADYLPTPFSRLNQIYNNFFNSEFYTVEFNNIYMSSVFNYWPMDYKIILITLFMCGLISDFYHALKGNKKSAILLLTLVCILISMSFYLKLNWGRYFIQLIFFVVLYQILGLFFLLNLIKLLFKLIKNKK